MSIGPACECISNIQSSCHIVYICYLVLLVSFALLKLKLFIFVHFHLVLLFHVMTDISRQLECFSFVVVVVANKQLELKELRWNSD